MKSFLTGLVASLALTLMLLCYSCEATGKVPTEGAGEKQAVETAEGARESVETKAVAAQPQKPKPVTPEPVEKKPQIKKAEQAKAASVEEKPKGEPVVEKVGEPENVVAKIGDYVITSQALEKKLISELRGDADEFSEDRKAVDVKTLLMKMLAEKAMIMEGREQGYLEDEGIASSLKRFSEGRLINLLLRTELEAKVTATQLEIEEKLKEDAKLDPARAKAAVERAKARKLVAEYYERLYKKFHVQKRSENFPKAVGIHRRLLLSAAKGQRMHFVKRKQVTEELSAEEKDIVLAAYDNGRITLKDWFDALCDMSPPSRPRDLNTVKGVEGLLDRAMRKPIFVAEAKLRALDKDESYARQLREREDGMLLNKVRREKLKDIKKPAPQELVAYFNEHKQEFMTPRTLKVDQIWCEDLKTAEKAKAELSGGGDFDSVKKEYSLDKQGKARNTYPSAEGIFFEELWKAEVNEIAGPMKGFYRSAVKWRIVKILEKKPGEMQEYSDNMEYRVTHRIRTEQKEAIMAEYRKQLLEKYPSEIYFQRIENIDPLRIP